MTNSDVVKRFGKRSLLDIAEELGVLCDSSLHVYKLVERIKSDLDEAGVPEPDDMSDDLYDLAIALGIMDENGDLLDEEKGVELKKSIIEPPCYGQGDKKDPACRKCPLLDDCIALRIKRRPSCFGALYDESTDECDICIYWQNCKAEMPKK